MRFSVRLKIFAAMGTALVLVAAVGADGLIGVSATHRLVQQMFASNVQAIIAVGETQKAIVDERIAVNRALVDTSTRNTTERVRKDEAEEGAAWARYYPSQVSTPEEKAAAEHYIALRAIAMPLLEQQVALLDAGKVDQARQLLLGQTAGALGKMAEQIQLIVDMNGKQAEEAAAEADASYAKTRYTAIALLGFAVATLLGVAFAIVRAVIRPLTQARSLAQAIQGGRLNNATLVTGNDEFTDTLRALAQMDQQLAGIVSDVRDISEQVTAAAADISQGNDDLSQRTQEQASSLEETAASMEELAATVNQNAEGAEQARHMADALRADAEQGGRIAHEAKAAMGEITQASQQIGDIVTLIDEIAFQTNLLALNAAVEAARAGEQGRGFAVVSTEVRNLAQRSASAAKDIKALVGPTVERVDAGAALVAQTGTSLETIARGVRSVHAVVSEIAAASREQSAGIGQVNQAVLTLDEVTQQNAALVEEASATSKNASDLSRELLRQVAFFQVEGRAREVSIDAAPKARPTVTATTPRPVALASGDAQWQEF
jgi:methyl-accepting chemotaxis protein